MRMVNIHTAKTHLSRLVDEVAVWIADDFDEPLPEKIMAAFRGERP